MLDKQYWMDKFSNEGELDKMLRETYIELYGISDPRNLTEAQREHAAKEAPKEINGAILYIQIFFAVMFVSAATLIAALLALIF